MSYMKASVYQCFILFVSVCNIEVKRFAEQSALMIVDKATDRLSLFELSEKGGNYRFEKDGDEVKLLAQ